MSYQNECLICGLSINLPVQLLGWDEVDGSGYAERGQVITHQCPQKKLPQER